jgi:hypothetical protein
VDESIFQAVGSHPFLIYDDAAALGYFTYQSSPPELLDAVSLSQLHCARDPAYWSEQAVRLRLPPLASLMSRLQTSRQLRFAYSGDRVALAECLIGQLSPELVRSVSFSTSLVPSSDRPFVLTLVHEKTK